MFKGDIILLVSTKPTLMIKSHGIKESPISIHTFQWTKAIVNIINSRYIAIAFMLNFVLKLQAFIFERWSESIGDLDFVKAFFK
jgi:hypothetical protein